MFYGLFLCGIIDWVFRDIPVRIGGQIGKSTYAIGGRSLHMCAYDGGRGSY